DTDTNPISVQRNEITVPHIYRILYFFCIPANPNLVKKISRESSHDHRSSGNADIGFDIGDIISFKPKDPVFGKHLEEFLSKFYEDSFLIRIPPHVRFTSIARPYYSFCYVVGLAGIIYLFPDGEVHDTRSIIPEFDEIPVHTFHEEGIL